MRGRIASPAYSRVDEWTGTEVIARIEAGVGLGGIIHLEDIEFWNSVNETWVSSPPLLPVGSDIGFRVPVENPGDVKQHMKLRVEVCRPGRISGVTPELYHALNAGETRIFEFGTDFFGVYNFPAGDEEGEYTIVELILYADVY